MGAVAVRSLASVNRLVIILQTETTVVSPSNFIYLLCPGWNRLAFEVPLFR